MSKCPCSQGGGWRVRRRRKTRRRRRMKRITRKRRTGVRKRRRRSQRAGSGAPRNIPFTELSNMWRGTVNGVGNIGYAWAGEPGTPSPYPTDQSLRPWDTAAVPKLINLPAITAAAGMSVRNT